MDINIPPRSKECDVEIVVKGRPLDITVSPSFMLGLVAEFNVSQPLNLRALQDMLLESIGLLRNTDQDVLTRSKLAAQKPDPALSLKLDLQIGTVYVPEDVCDIEKTVLAVNLGRISVELAGHKLEAFRDPDAEAGSKEAEQEYKYMPINVAVKGFGVKLLPETCAEPLIKPTDLSVNLKIVDAKEKKLPSSMPNVRIAVSTLPIVLSLNGSTFHRLLQSVATIVMVIPTENLVPPDEKALVDSMRESGFDLFFERDKTQAALRNRMHNQSVKFVEFDEQTLGILQRKRMMVMELNVPSVQVVCWREKPPPGSAAAAAAAAADSGASFTPTPCLRVDVSGFAMQLDTRPYDTQVNMQLHDIVVVGSTTLPSGATKPLQVLSFDGKDPATGVRPADQPVFTLAVRGAKPLSAHFAELRGTSEVNLEFGQCVDRTPLASQGVALLFVACVACGVAGMIASACVLLNVLSGWAVSGCDHRVHAIPAVCLCRTNDALHATPATHDACVNECVHVCCVPMLHARLLLLLLLLLLPPRHVIIRLRRDVT